MSEMLAPPPARRAAPSPGPTAPSPRRLTVDPASDPLWTDLLQRHQHSVFHAPPWLAALRDTYELDLRADVLLDDDGRAAAGIAYCPVRDPMGTRIVSLPFSDYCDPLLHDPAAWSALSAPLIDRHPVQLRCLHDTTAPQDPRFELTGRARWHQVVLGEPTQAWSGLDPSARRAVRKARELGVTVSAAEHEDELRAFFELHLQVRKHKYRLLAQPYRFFQALWEGFLREGHGALLLARREGEIIAGVLFLGWDDTLYYKFNASDPRHLDARPNDLIVWEALRYASDRGYRALDFGLSAWDQEGLLRFKRKYATDEATIHLLRSAPSGGPSSEELELRALLDRLTGLLVDPDVPDRITEEAGDALYRYFV
jgi:CelD/BcsL family acetyltransferase involved in cellulose biosynthesis